MNQLQVFNFGKTIVRTIEKEGQPWFVLKDVCDVLELRSPDVRQRLNDDVVSTHTVPDSLGRSNNATIINEDGLYDVILESRKPEAKAFRKWVTSEVLPTIRKTGGYVSNDDLFVSTYLPHIDENAKLIFRATLESMRKANEKIAIMQPKADFFDQVASSKDAIDIGTAAKVLKIPGVGRNTLFEKLRQSGVLMNNNQPYQKYIDQGYFRVVEQKYTKPDGSTSINIKTLVYQKGLDFIRRTISKGETA